MNLNYLVALITVSYSVTKIWDKYSKQLVRDYVLGSKFGVFNITVNKMEIG